MNGQQLLPQLEPPTLELAAQDRREAIEAVRRAMVNQGVPVASVDTPLGLPLDKDG